MDITDRTDMDEVISSSKDGFKDRLEILVEIGGDMIMPCGLNLAYVNRFGALNKLFRHYGRTKEDDSISFFGDCLYLLRHIEQIERSKGSISDAEHDENRTLIESLDEGIYGITTCDLFDSAQMQKLENYINWISDPFKYVSPPKPKKKRNQGYVYVMRDNRNSMHKIGFTRKEPKYRETTLQSEQPDITLVWSIWKDMAFEKYLHGIFAEKRVRGEWFNLSDEDLNEIFEMSDNEQ